MPKSPKKPIPFGERIKLPEVPMCIVGIDPGASSGAICFLEAYLDNSSTPVPTIHNMCDIPSLRGMLKSCIKEFSRENVIVFMENPSGVPSHKIQKVGLSSSMKFSRHIGMLEGLLIGLYLKHQLISPMKWQNRLGCRTGGDKKISLAAAQQRYPSEKLTQRNADSILIAHYGCLWQLGEK